MLASDRPDDELLADLRNPESLELFYRRHVEAITRFASRRCANTDQVVELVSIVFLEVIDSASTYDARRGAARPWLFGIAVRCLADLRRDDLRARDAARRLGGRAELSDDDVARIDARIDAARLAPRLGQAIAALPEKERELVLLVRTEDLTVADAARALGITPVAARVRLARARRRIRHRLAESPDALVATAAIGKECS